MSDLSKLQYNGPGEPLDEYSFPSSFDDILNILQYVDVQEWDEGYEGEESWDEEAVSIFEGEGSKSSEDVDILMDYRQQMETKLKEEQSAKADQKKEQLRSLIGITKKKDMSAETILTEQEEGSLPPEEVFSEESVHPCLMTVDISDSRLKIANLYTLHAIPKDPGLIQAYRTLHPRRHTYSDDGVDKFIDTAEKMGIPAIQGMKEMLMSDKVDLRYYGVNPRIVKAISEALEANVTVRVLNLKDNWLSADACYFLNKLLLKNSSLNELNLSGCRIGVSGAARLSQGIANNTALTSLDVSHCDLRAEGLASIKKGVCENKCLQNLNLRGNSLDENCALSLQDLLACSGTLRSLNLSWNSLYKSEVWRALIKSLVKCILTDLDLSWNALAGECVQHLCRFVARSPTLEKLNLSGNRFTDDNAGPLSKAIAKNNVIKEVYLGNNAFRDPGVFTLISTIAKPTESNLRVLDLTNSWGKKNVIPELDKIKSTRPWVDIRLGGILSNYKVVGPDAAKILFKRALYEAMKPRNRKLRKNFGHFVLSLKDEPISKAKFRELMRAFRLKLSDSLKTELINLFPDSKKGVDVPLLKSVYLREYPDTTLPPPKVPKAKKPKKEKKEKKKAKPKADAKKAKPEKTKGKKRKAKKAKGKTEESTE